MSPKLILLGTLLALPVLLPSTAFSQTSTPSGSSSSKSAVERANSGTVGLISGGFGGTYIRVAADLAMLLNKGDDLRIVPIVGQGSLQNVTDILYLKGIDLGIVQSDILTYVRRNALFSDVENRVHYITKLYNEEFHVVARRNIRSIEDLAGLKVNFGVKGSGTFITASTVFESLRIRVTPVNLHQSLAIEKVKSGEIAATVYVSGKPVGTISRLRNADGLHLVNVPFKRALQADYLPASFTSEDYPELVKANERVNSIAVGAVMAAYNWKAEHPRYRNLERFVDAFFSNFQKLQIPPHHKKWREVNLAAKLPNWKRFTPARRWLTKNGVSVASDVKSEFNRFLDQIRLTLGNASLSPPQKEKLFKQFLNWKNSQSR